MTEATEGQIASPMESNSSANVDNQVSEPVSSTPTQAVEAPVQEKMIPQSKVNEIVQARLAKERDASSRKQEPVQDQQVTTQEQQNVAPDISQAVATELDKRLQSMQDTQREEAALSEAKKTLESLQTKIDEAATKYEDFEEVTKDVPYSSFPGLLTAANSVDNSGDVLYHLGKNPSKMRELASSFQPVIDPYSGQQTANPMAQVAMKELRQLSDSMRNNELAKQKDRPREPLSQIRPSNVGSDSGRSSISDLRKKWLA
jgi:hypothetical protein